MQMAEGWRDKSGRPSGITGTFASRGTGHASWLCSARLAAAKAKSVLRDGECPQATEPQLGSRCVRGVGVNAAGAHLDSDAGKRLSLGRSARWDRITAQMGPGGSLAGLVPTRPPTTGSGDWSGDGGGGPAPANPGPHKGRPPTPPPHTPSPPYPHSGSARAPPRTPRLHSGVSAWSLRIQGDAQNSAV